MSVTRATAVTKVRLRLQDKTTRRDGTAVANPRFPDADVQQALNDVIRDRAATIAEMDKEWYRATKDYTGQSDAIGGTSNEQYNLPSDFKAWEELRRSDLSFFPVVPLIDFTYQDANKFLFASLWSGFYAAHPENVAPAGTTAALLPGGAIFRLLPAPVSTAFKYKLFYQRNPTEPASDTAPLDLPDAWQEVVAIEAALYLASAVNDEVAPRLEKQLAAALQARERDYHGRDASRATFGPVRFGGQIRF